ncbi:YitT family protein [Lachnospiraceae bacterium CLA-AA-H215]|uniref:YitT family protein n=1 Tax=Hominifimenecus microfluidus TaxID=2885348 RepID=A0AAE3JG33_9FIRM|nr:YitT family protein [Hominifimenecus microfluidus]MCC2232854.1 YitT family protein [Hominifimenecus microfluidus]
MKMDVRKVMDEGWRMLASVILMGVAMLVFTVPNHIVPGGVSGLSTAVAELVPLKVGTVNFILSVIIEGMGCLNFGVKFVMRSLIISTGLSIFLNIFEGMIPAYTSDPLVAAIAGGAMFGVSCGILLGRGISSGGTDTITLIIKKYFPHVSVGKTLMLTDALVVLVSTIIFKNIDVAIYSAFTIFCSGQVVDKIVVGMDVAKLIYVITDSPEKIQNHLVEKMDLGVTVLTGKGGFSQTEKGVLMLAVRRPMFSAVLRAVKQLDVNSFVIVQDASEVWGEGFKEHNQGQ